MNETNTNLPTTLSYTKDDVSKAVAKKLLRAGWYAVVLQANHPGEAKSGSFKFEQDFVPLKDASDADSRGTVKIRNFLTLPFLNPNKEGHKVPDTLGICQGQLRAFGGEFYAGIPDYPRKEDGVWTFKGEPMTGGKEESKAAREEVGDAIMARLAELWSDPSKMQGAVCFAKVVVQGDYNNIAAFKAELPDGEELVAPEDWFKSAE